MIDGLRLGDRKLETYGRSLRLLTGGSAYFTIALSVLRTVEIRASFVIIIVLSLHAYVYVIHNWHCSDRLA